MTEPSTSNWASNPLGLSKWDWFEEMFYKELESWFSADIACCDDCYEEFLSVWPLAYHANDGEFQKSSIPLDCFYSGSRLSDDFTQAEFDDLVQYIRCSRCGNPLQCNIWTFSFPFDVPADFEIVLEEVASLARRTPFLLLRNGFCTKVHSAITDLSRSVQATTIDQPLFRGRPIGPTVLDNLQSFDFPPEDCVMEGRYNHAGMPVLYAASDLTTCIEELRGTSCKILEFIHSSDLKILDLTQPDKLNNEYSDLINLLVYSSLLSAKQDHSGWHKPEYIFSRYVADCARDAGFDAIRYYSTRIVKNNFNLVLIDPKLALQSHAQFVRTHEHIF